MDIDKFCQQIHSKLVIMTSDGSYEGMLKFISVSKQRVTFEHVYELPSRDYLGTVDMLLSGILSWRILESEEENFDISNFDSSEKVLDSEFVKFERMDYSELIDIAPDKYFMDYLPMHLRNNCPTDFCIIDSMDAVFYEAVKHLSESTDIGISCHGPKVSRFGILTWISLSTSTCVFLFDIKRLGKSAFEEGLKKILEDENIEKIIHDCRKVADCMFHSFDTDLKCIFDTQVADYLINMQVCTGKRIFKYVNSLDSCLFKYLKVPQQFLYNHNVSLLSSDEVKFYEERPVSKNFINVLLKSSMYLIYLKEEQKKLLMSPYEQAVELSLSVVRSASDSEVNMLQTEDFFTTPSYLLESVKSIHFHDVPQSTENPLKQLKDTLCDQDTMSVAERQKYLAKILQNNSNQIVD